MKRTLDTTNMEQAAFAGVEHEGDPGQWVCIVKAWNKNEGWMKSTKVLEVPGAGCFLQVTTKEKDAVAEAVCWAPGVRLCGDKGILEADFGDVEDEEDALADFDFSVTAITNMVVIRALFRGTMIDRATLSRMELRQSDEHVLDVLNPFLDSVLHILQTDYDSEADKGALIEALFAAIDPMRH